MGNTPSARPSRKNGVFMERASQNKAADNGRISRVPLPAQGVVINQRGHHRFVTILLLSFHGAFIRRSHFPRKLGCSTSKHVEGDLKSIEIREENHENLSVNFP